MGKHTGMITASIVGMAAGLMIAGSAMAADMPELAKKSGCTACHSIDKKLVGPAWAEVGKKYAGDAKAEAVLIEKANKMGDMGQPDGWREMVCVESVNAIENVMTVAAGTAHSLVVEYRAEPM